MLIEMQGVCKYCGQSAFVEMEEGCDQVAADRVVTRNCMCEGSERENAIMAANANLRALAVDNAVDLGYEYALDSEVVTELKRIIPLIYDGVFTDVKVMEPGGDMVRIARGIRCVTVRRTHKVDRKL